MTETVIEKAREFAAVFLDGMRRQDLALMIRAGHGDDFPEVVTAAALLDQQVAQISMHEEAIKAYADTEFWEDGLPGGSLASHDKGQMARMSLSGDRRIITANDQSAKLLVVATYQLDQRPLKTMIFSDMDRSVAIRSLDQQSGIWSAQCPHGTASNTMLNGPSAARRTVEKPPDFTISDIFRSPACAPKPSPTSCANDVGTQIMVEAL